MLSRKKIFGFVSLLLAVMLSSCTIINHSPALYVPPHTRWAVLPFANNTETPQAGKRATAMVSGILRAGGVSPLYVYESKESLKTMLSNPQTSTSMRKALAWARSRRVDYAVAGTVNEWRYKVGIDGEPAVSLTMFLVDMHDGHVIWSSVGSRTGGSRSGLGVVSQGLMNYMLHNLLYKGKQHYNDSQRNR